MEERMARVNVTYDGCIGDLTDPVPYDISDTEVLKVAEESIESNTVVGIPAQTDVDLEGYVVERFPINPEAGRVENVIMLRPKSAYGKSSL